MTGYCGNCGHTIGARCSQCNREMLCGSVSEPCPVEGCAERVIAPKYGGRNGDLSGGPVENPRSVRQGA